MAFTRFSGLLKRNAIAAASFSLSMKYGVADIMTQYAQATAADKADSTLNKKRTGLFFLFGAMYGTINYHVFKWYTLIPGTNALVMTAVDAGLHLPLMFMPCFYFTKEFINASAESIGSIHSDNNVTLSTDSDYETRSNSAATIPDISLSRIATDAMHQYKTNFIEDFKAICMVWIPVNLVTFR
jgi:hypothetical protein